MLDVIPWLREERLALLELLGGLSRDAWDLPTECPLWTVHGVALHILGDDLSLIARQRDGAPSGLIAMAQRGAAKDFSGLLDAFNEEWVAAAAFLSPQLVCELLRLTDDWTADFYDKVPPDRLGEPVPWLGPEPAPYWLIAAREYVERWVHHQQIARATDSSGPGDEATLRAVEALSYGFARLLGPVHAPDDAVVALTVLDRSWILSGPGGGWAVQPGASPSPTASLTLSSSDDAARAFSRGLTAAEMTAAFACTGDPELAGAVVRLFVEAFSSSY
jgi:uncharacterized protein (TIGR03083 family)